MAVAGTWSIVVLVFLVGAIVASIVAAALGGASGLNAYDWQTFATDAFIVAPLFPVLPLTAAAAYDLLLPAAEARAEGTAAATL